MIGVQNVKVSGIHIHPQPLDILGVFNKGNGVVHVGFEGSLLPEGRFVFAIAQKVIDAGVIQK